MADTEKRELQDENKRLWDHLIKLREWKERLEGEKSQLQVETTQLRAANTNLEAETTRLRSQTASARAETTLIRAQATDLRQKNDELQASARRSAEELGAIKVRLAGAEAEKAALVKRVPVRESNLLSRSQLTTLFRQTVKSVPLEIIANIASFLAGSNSFRTLMSFSVMNKRIRQECAPMCYETIIMPDTNYWALRLKRVITGDPPPEAWKWCK